MLSQKKLYEKHPSEANKNSWRLNQDARPGFLQTALMEGQTSASAVTLAAPRLEERGASASAFALAAVRVRSHTGGKFPARKIPLQESVSTFLHFLTFCCRNESQCSQSSAGISYTLLNSLNVERQEEGAAAG